MENQNQKPTREATPATLHQVRFKVIQNLLADPEAKFLNGSLTDEQVNDLAGLMADFLRKSGCHVSITTPQDIIDQAASDHEDFFENEEGYTDEELRSMLITPEEARQACRLIENNKYLCEVSGSTYNEVLVDLVEQKYEDLKKNRNHKN